LSFWNHFLMNQQGITSAITVKKLLDAYPRAALAFFRMGMFCPGCPAQAFHSLAEAASEHNQNLDELLARICCELGDFSLCSGDPAS
jgi:hybrid cluster-associated redox disulfide protein